MRNALTDCTWVRRARWVIGQWAVGSGQWAVGSGQWAVGEGVCEHKDSVCSPHSPRRLVCATHLHPPFAMEQIVDLRLLSPSTNGTPYQLFARQWLIDHAPGNANATEWRQLFATSAITVLRTAPPNLTADGIARSLSECEPSTFERVLVARGYKQLVENGVARWMCTDDGDSMLRPLESAVGGPLTKALNKAWNASRLQPVQAAAGPAADAGRVLPPRRSPLRPTSLRRSTLRSYRRAIECRDGVPKDRFARQWLLQHTPVGDAAQQVWTSLWGKLFTDEWTDAPGPPSELELSLRAAWDLER